VSINLGPYSKFVTALIGIAVTYAAQYYGTNPWVAAAVAVASALGVYAVPNQEKPQPPPSSPGGM
jgi:hypothetical protein